MNICPKCDRRFSCEIEDGKSRCWCFDIDIDRESLNHIRDMGYSGCLCSDCLENVKNARLNSLYIKYSNDS